MPSTGWPPSMPFTLMVAWRAAGGIKVFVDKFGIDELRRQVGADRFEQSRHAVDGAHPEERHAAVRDATARRHFEPVDAAVPDADAVDVERLRNDDVIGAAARKTAGLRQVGHAGKPAALLVHRPADFDGARQRDARAHDRFSRKHRRGDPRFHVAHAASVDLPIAHNARERIDRPAAARRDDVEMPVQVNDPARPATSAADNVDARISRCVLGPAFGREILHDEAALREIVADEVRAGLVLVARRIHRRNADQIDGVLHDFIASSIHFGKDAIDIDGGHQCVQ